MTTVREMRPDDARAFLEVHHAAVRGLAAKDYNQAVIDDWAPLPVTDKAVERFLLNPDNEIRLVAEHDGEVVGIGALVIDKAELRACYVAPEASRKGVGSALVREIERIAEEHGVGALELDSSVTAEPFYLARGYEVRERGEHILRSGQAMACVKMVKSLQPRAQHL
jgi:putative acetyltransferase